MLEKITSKQWFDTDADMFLADRFVTGVCPKCDYPKAYSTECDECGATYEAEELKSPVSQLSGTRPILQVCNPLVFRPVNI